MGLPLLSHLHLPKAHICHDPSAFLRARVHPTAMLDPDEFKLYHLLWAIPSSHLPSSGILRNNQRILIPDPLLPLLDLHPVQH